MVEVAPLLLAAPLHRSQQGDPGRSPEPPGTSRTPFGMSRRPCGMSLGVGGNPANRPGCPSMMGGNPRIRLGCPPFGPGRPPNSGGCPPVTAGRPAVIAGRDGCRPGGGLAGSVVAGRRLLCRQASRASAIPPPAEVAAIFTVKSAAMFPRSLPAPRSSCFLFGPRGTGKSTWVRTAIPEALTVNLLPPEATLRYEREPSLFPGRGAGAAARSLDRPRRGAAGAQAPRRVGGESWPSWFS
jgi:hypothetical protein